MKKTNRPLCILVLASLVMFATGGPAAANEVKNTMKEMKNSFNAALSSNNMSDFIKYESAFITQLNHASTLAYSPDQKTYQQGIKTLQAEMEPVNKEILANNLPAAKNALSKLVPTKKRYHNLLN
jgi:soluble cytochrome b562